MLSPLHKKLPTAFAKAKAQHGQMMSNTTAEALYGSADPTELPKPAQRARPSKRQQLKREEASLLREKDIIDRRLNEITAELDALPLA